MPKKVEDQFDSLQGRLDASRKRQAVLQEELGASYKQLMNAPKGSIGGQTARYNVEDVTTRIAQEMKSRSPKKTR